MKIKYYIQILLLFFVINLQSQNSTISFDSLSCERAKFLVQNDLEKGIYRAYLRRKGEGYSKTFEKILKEDFGIEALLFQSCSKEYFIDCYNEISIPLIQTKFGEDIFEKARLKAKELDDSGRGERNAKYPNGKKELIKFIYCQLDLELLKKYKSKKNYPIPTVTLYISKEGKVYDQKIEFCQDERIIKEIKRIVQLLPTFQNATKGGKPAEATRCLPIHFHRKWKRKNCR